MEVKVGDRIIPSDQKATIANNEVMWRSNEVINGHMLIVGGSGTGKTVTLRKVISQMMQTTSNPLRIHVLDVHDDIAISGASEVLFSESSDVGLNPLIVDPDPHSGGVRKTIQNFIGTINKVSRQIGERQEAVLRALLEELYAANGFHADKPHTWRLHDGVPRNSPKKYPNIEDLSRWTNFKYKQLFMGGDRKTVGFLEKLNREAIKLQKLAKDKWTTDDVANVDKLKDDAIGAYSDYVNSIKSGRELDDLLKYDSKNTLKSVLDRIDNLKNCGVFRSKAPDFDTRSQVWRYRIKNLGTAEKKMFVYFMLKDLYDKALQRGETDHICEVIILDEASMFMDSDPDNIISIMANQIRKFGTALVCSSQAFTHFSDDFLASVATKIILGIDEMYWDKTARQLQFKKDYLNWITPRRTAVVQVKRHLPPNHPEAKVKWYLTKLTQVTQQVA